MSKKILQYLSRREFLEIFDKIFTLSMEVVCEAAYGRREGVKILRKDQKISREKFCNVF